MAARRSLALVGLMAGVAGTACMSASLGVEATLRVSVEGPVNYDASSHVVTAGSTVLHWTPRTQRQRRTLFLLVHWGYGSAAGIAYPYLGRALRGYRAAAALFYGGCQAMAMILFPTLGGTPPP